MVLLGSMLTVAAFTFIVFQLWERLADTAGARRWFWRWHGKGITTPILVWMVLGVGVVPGLPGLVPHGGPGAGAWEIAALGVFLIASYWGGLTVAWLTVTATQQIPRENLPDLRGMWLTRSVLTLPLGAFVFLWTGWGGAGIAVTVWLLPVAHGLPSLRTVAKKTPIYAAAVAKMKSGKYDEAEWEVIRQLEEAEEDFQGWLMLAELYACHFEDLPGAARVVRDLCDQPNVSPSDVGVALHRLADWQLQFADDPGAARRALEEIRTRYPDTHLAFMAGQRMDQLPASTAELLERRKPRLIALPKRGHRADGPAAPAPVFAGTEEESRAAADACVKTLTGNPNDVAARERFARLLAEQLNRAALAVEQLELLLAMPGQPGPRQAAWLGLMAHWQLRQLQDLGAGRRTLQRLVSEFPNTRDGFDAQRRLCLLDVEERFRKARAEAAPA